MQAYRFRRKNWRKVFVLSAALIGPGFLTAPSAKAQNIDDRRLDAGGLDTIVVIGERQTKSLLETTTSVAIYDEDALENEAGQTINEVIQSSANTLIRSLSEAPIIRGVEGGGPGGLAQTGLAGTQPRIPLIIDEIVRPSSIANSDFNTLWDVEQVEILKGTQTSLRGRSTIGGAIIVKTNDPAFEPEAALQGVVEFDDFHGATYIVNGMASGGVIEDRLAFRGTVEYRTGDDPRDLVGVLPGQEDKVDALTEFEQLRFRGKALFLPEGEAGPWRILGTVEYQDGTTAQTRGTVLATDFDAREMLFTGGLRLFDTEAWVGGLDMSYTFGDGGRLRSITSYGVSDFSSTDDQPITPIPQNFFFDFKEEIFNQDLIYTLSDNRRLTGLIGASYTLRDQAFSIVNEFPPIPSGQLSSATQGDQETYSLFADLRLAITNRLDVIGGGRVLHDNNNRQTFSALLALPSPPFPFSVPPASQDFNESETVALPSVGLQFKITPQQSLAFTAREGWNPGGAAIQPATAQPITFQSERVWTYEAAYRIVSGDQRTSFSATAFFSDYDNPQFFLQVTPGALASTIVVNLPASQTYGVELEAATTLADELKLSASFGFLETEVTDSIASRPDLVGNRIGKDPDITATAGFDWTPTFAPGLSVNGQVSYVGAFFNDFNNFPDQEIGDYALVDLGLSYAFEHFEARAFVNNVTDEAGVNALVTQFGEVTLPRTFGISLTGRFN